MQNLNDLLKIASKIGNVEAMDILVKHGANAKVAEHYKENMPQETIYDFRTKEAEAKIYKEISEENSKVFTEATILKDQQKVIDKAKRNENLRKLPRKTIENMSKGFTSVLSAVGIKKKDSGKGR